MRLARRAGDGRATDAPDGAPVDPIDVDALTASFAPPRWLRDVGRASWALVGFFLLLAGLIWLLWKTSTIVDPVLIGLVVATVASPVVTWLAEHRVPRALGSILLVLALLALAVVVVLLVVGGITSQGDVLAQHATAAADKAQAWVEDAGVSQGGAENAKEHVETAVPAIISTLTTGIAAGISGLASAVFGIVFTVFALFFLLKDGPKFRRFVDTHLGVPVPVARAVTRNVVQSVRAYFLGVTIVAIFNAVVVGLGAVVLGVPLAGTIAVVTAVTAYVPFIGAFVAGTLAVVVALGAKGTTVALVMLVIVILANGLLQNIVQPIAFGATLDLNPLLILVVTISAGSLFGMVGLILAAPLTSAAFHIARDVGRARAAVPAVPAVPADV
jgi:predicted PurR-regulated permease PerM